MKKLTILTILLIISTIFIASNRHDGDGRINNQSFAVSSLKLDANQISTWFRTNGSFNRNPTTTGSGFEWPKGSGKTARYASGIWLGAKVGNDTLVAICEYDYEYLPGYTNASGNGVGKDDPLYRIYKLVKGSNDFDRNTWPNALLGNSDQGAPVVFENGAWKPLDFGTITLFYAYTDAYPEAHANRAGSTRPLKADIKQVNFSFNFGGALGDIAFSQFTIINRSTQPWNDAYLTLWTDDDLGSDNDDKVGVDSALGLGYTYNGDDDDPIYGPHPPAVGFDFFRGAIIYTGIPTDIAYVCEGKTRVAKVGYRQLGLNVFNWYRNGDPVNGDPRIYYEAYRQMKGLTRDGNVLINPNGNFPTTFIYSGDPVSGTGWNQQIQADQRFLQSTGPFTMNPGDTQIIVAGQVIARGSTNLNSIKELRLADKFAQLVYDNCFTVPNPPSHPSVTSYAPGNGKIYFSWDDKSEKGYREFNPFSSRRDTITGLIIDSAFYYFQGYNVYQIKSGTNGSESADRTLLATYDRIDSVTDIYDSVYIGINAHYALAQKGYDNGIRRTFVLDKDYILSKPLINGSPYYIAIVPYAYDSLAFYRTSTPHFNMASVPSGVITVIPQALTQGTQTFYSLGDTISTSSRDLGALPIVVNPLALINATYTATLSPNLGLSWSLAKTVGGSTTTLLTDYADLTGRQDTAKVFDGMMTMLQTVGDSGVVRDVNDPLTPNLKTRQNGWSYTPSQNRWVKGATVIAAAKVWGARPFQSSTMGFSHPSANNFNTFRSRIFANGTQFQPIDPGVNDMLTGGPLRKIKIVFGQTQKAYRYAPDVDSVFNPLPYRNMVDVPFQVFAIDPLDSTGGAPRQLNVAIIDGDNNGVWDPDTTKYGGYEMVYFFASGYNANPNPIYTDKNPGSGSFSTGFASMDIMYVWAPRVIRIPNGPPLTYTAGDVLEIYPYLISRPEFVPGYPVKYSWTVQGSILGNSGLATSRNDMDKVNVFPNPYFGGSRLETNSINRFIYFSNLPSKCTIYIYSLSGVLVRKINRDNTDPNNSLEKWDLRNQDDISVASGMYIAVVDFPGVGTKVLKFAIFTPEERINVF